MPIDEESPLEEAWSEEVEEDESDAVENGVEPQVRQIHVHRRLPGRRLDKYLRAQHPRLSRTILQRYVKQGLVTVNDLPTKASYEPADGDVIRIPLPPPPPVDLIPEDI